MFKLTKDINKLTEYSIMLRKDIVKMIGIAKSGHPGGSLSSIDILTVLYYSRMKHDPSVPLMENRDRFVLSKGHAAPALYAVLARTGYFPVKELWSLRKTGCMLQGHPDNKGTPGVENPSGSLGQGLSQANGMALAGKIDNKNYKVFSLIGDGETQEGQIWEAAMTAAHHKLDNLCVFLDYNKLQIDGNVNNIKNLKPLPEKWSAFNWHVIQINGHSFAEIISAIDESDNTKGKPSIIIADTIKGKGVSFMENQLSFHGVAPSKEEVKKAIAELK